MVGVQETAQEKAVQIGVQVSILFRAVVHVSIGRLTTIM